MIKFECIEKIVNTLKDKFPNMQVNAFGYSEECLYDQFHSFKNPNDFFKVQLFKGGFNPNYNEETKQFVCGEFVDIHFCCTEYNSKDVKSIITKITKEYNYLLDFPNETRGFIHIAENEDELDKATLPF